MSSLVVLNGMPYLMSPEQKTLLRNEVQKKVLDLVGMKTCEGLPQCLFFPALGQSDSEALSISISIQIRGITGKGNDPVLTRKRLKVVLEVLMREFFPKVKEVECYFAEPNP